MAEQRERYAIGVDVGGTKIAAAIAGSGGVPLAEAAEPTGEGVAAQVATILAGLLARLGADGRDLAAVALAVPAAVAPGTGALQLFQNIADPRFGAVAAELSSGLGAPILVENDANLAAYGEAAVRGAASLAFLSVGTGIGAGFVLDGRLLRGHRGLAGEVAWLPIGGDPASPAARRDGALEAAAGSLGLLRRHAALGGRGVADVKALFDAAAAGENAARRVLDEAADLLTRAALAIAVILDPECVVLGGSIGVRPELADRVRTRLAAIAPVAVPLETSLSGPRAGVLGALRFALDASRRAEGG